MKGALWRLLCLKYKEIILPSITDPQRRELVAFVFSILTEIQWIVYAEPRMQKNPIIQLHLHVLCFLLAININESYHLTGTGLLYIHTVISHFGPWYEKCDFRNGSTESGEMFIAMCKNWALRYSSRRHDDALLEILVRLHFEAKVRRHCFHGDEVSRNKISREFEDHQWKELSLSDKLVDKYETDITAFLCMLQYYSYTMGVHYSFKKTQCGVELSFNTTGIQSIFNGAGKCK